MGRANILTISINYHSEKQTVEFVREILELQSYASQKIIVVDNSGELNSESSTLKPLRSDDRLLVYSCGKNVGYYGGASWALKKYLKEFPLPDWVIVCNTDVHLMGADFFARLLEYHTSNPPAVVSPIVFSELSGREWSAYTPTRPSNRHVHVYKWILNFYPTLFAYNALSHLKGVVLDRLHILRNKTKYESQSGDKPFNVYAPGGALTIFHRGYFGAGGNLDHASFLYGEEIFVGETARRLNLNVVFDPRLRIMHKGRSATNIFKHPKILRFKRDAVNHYANAYFNRRQH